MLLKDNDNIWAVNQSFLRWSFQKLASDGSVSSQSSSDALELANHLLNSRSSEKIANLTRVIWNITESTCPKLLFFLWGSLSKISPFPIFLLIKPRWHYCCTCGVYCLEASVCILNIIKWLYRRNCSALSVYSHPQTGLWPSGLAQDVLVYFGAWVSNQRT